MLLALHMLALGIIAVIFIGMIVLHRRARATQKTTPSADGLASPGQSRHPSLWLAIHTSDFQAVQATLGMHRTTFCSPAETVSGGHEFFIKGPVNGWIIVTGPGLPRPGHDVDHCFHFLIHLSRTLRHVQFFMADPVAHHHAWVRVEDGVIKRAYAWAGETVWNQGTRTSGETELNMKCFGYAENPGMIDGISAQRHAALNTWNVPLLAARWSINPAAVDQDRLRSGDGFVGRSAPFHQD